MQLPRTAGFPGKCSPGDPSGRSLRKTSGTVGEWVGWVVGGRWVGRRGGWGGGLLQVMS